MPNEVAPVLENSYPPLGSSGDFSLEIKNLHGAEVDIGGILNVVVAVLEKPAR